MLLAVLVYFKKQAGDYSSYFSKNKIHTLCFYLFLKIWYKTPQYNNMQQKCKYQTHLPYLHSRDVCIFTSACSLDFTVFQSIFSKLAVINECRKVSHWNKKFMSDSFKKAGAWMGSCKNSKNDSCGKSCWIQVPNYPSSVYWKIDESYARDDEWCQKLCQPTIYQSLAAVITFTFL